MAFRIDEMLADHVRGRSRCRGQNRLVNRRPSAWWLPSFDNILDRQQHADCRRHVALDLIEVAIQPGERLG